MTTLSSDAKDIIQKLDLQPHPEGGFYRRTYCANERITKADGTQRHASTGIYYLLQQDAYSAWHRIDADEMWHFYAGDPLLIHTFDEHGEWKAQRLGNMLQQPDAVCQYVVPAGRWFAAEREGSQGYSLVGCTVAPGFEFANFELADMQVLLSRYPRHAAVIRRLAPRGNGG